MKLFKAKYIMAIIEPWIQEDFAAICVPILGATLITYPLDNEGLIFNLVIPILFFDVVIIWSNKPLTDK
jgi:hypothetical protein